MMDMYLRTFNSGVEHTGTFDMMGTVKWLLGLLIIYVVVQLYWSMYTGGIHVFTYYRYKSMRIWWIRRVIAVISICAIYTFVLIILDCILDSFEHILSILKLSILYYFFICNMNLFMCILTIWTGSRYNTLVWIIIYGLSSALSSTTVNRNYLLPASYGMMLQQDGNAAYIISFTMNIVMFIAIIAFGLLKYSGLKKRRGKV